MELRPFSLGGFLIARPFLSFSGSALERANGFEALPRHRNDPACRAYMAIPKQRLAPRASGSAQRQTSNVGWVERSETQH